MSYSLDKMIEAGDVDMQHRIRRFDVDWGRPPYAITYKRLAFTRMPAYYWSMSNSGTPAQSINLGYKGTAYNLSFAGSPTFTTGQADPTDNCVDFAGNAYSYTNAGAGVAELLGGYTISAVIKPTSMPGAYERCILSKANVNGSGLITVNIYQTGTSIYLKAIVTGNNTILNTTVPVPFNEWSHVAVVVEPVGPYTGAFIGRKRARGWNTAKVQFYLNGVLIQEQYVVNATPVNDGSQYNVGMYRIGNIPYDRSAFCGLLDEVAVHPTPLSSELIKRLAEVASGLSYFEPDAEFDTDVIGSYLVPVKYGDMIRGDKASAYWALDTRLNSAGNFYNPDGMGTQWTLGPQHLFLRSSSANNPSWFTNTDTGIHVSNKIGTDFGAIRFGGTGQQGFRNGVSFFNVNGSIIQPGTYSAFSAELWFKPGGTSGDRDGIIGYPNAGHGFVFAQSDGRQIFVYIQRPNGGGGTVVLHYPTNLIENSWYHLALTVTATGEATFFVNGVAQVTQNIGTGVYIPPANAFFCVGADNYGGNFDDIPAFWADEVALYGYALTPEQISNHYLTGVNGPYRRHRLTGGDPENQGSSYTLSPNEYSLLSNEVDISKYVADWTVDSDVKQLVSTGSLRVYEEWGLSEISNYLKANTYLIIERRYTSASLNEDTGWLPVAHMFVEGPLGMSMQANSRVYEISLKGLAKLLTLDIANVGVEPDKLFVTKRALDYRESTVEYTKFKLSHPTIAGGFYENWAEFPSVRLWVTDFQNIGDGNKGGVENSSEVLRIKGSEGAVKVLGGEGAVVIDNDFLNSSISDSGLGRPQTVTAEFWRYARPYDITNHQITAMVYNESAERWDVQVDSYAGEMDGKTVFIKSGSARGKIFRIRQPWVDLDGYSAPRFENTYTAGSTISTTNRTGADWPDFSGQTILTRFCAATSRTWGNWYNLTKLLRSSLTLGGNYALIPSTAKLVGIEISWDKVAHSETFQLPRSYVVDSGCYVKFATGYQTTSLDQAGEWPPSVWNTTKVGGVGQLFGLPSNLTWATISTWNTVEAYLGARVTQTNLTSIFSIGYQSIKVKLYLSDSVNQSPVLYLVDLNEFPINPVYEGMAVGDALQMGDFNRVEDALRKVAVRAQFQERDSTFPFYFSFDPCPAVLAPSVPPLRTTIFDGVTRLDLVEQILDAAPPNYRLIEKSNGELRAQLFGFVPGATPTHNLKATLDLNEDRSDYGVATRIISRGDSGDSINIALNKGAGGTSVCRAYTLSGYAAPSRYSMGRVVTQSEADAIWRQVFNGNPKSPVVTLSGDWYRNDKYDYYGTILYAWNPLTNVKRWTFEDVDLCAIDIGRSTSGSPIAIEAIDVTWFNQFLEGNMLKQTMYVYYMTEDDYEAVYGVPAPGEPDETDTDYFPPADSTQWRILVDEFVLNDGQTVIESGDFVNGKAERVRFLKFKSGQAHYRFPLDTGDERERAIATVNVAEIKVYTSREIVAVAELGNVAPFDTAEHKALATRLRRRTDVLDVNVALDSYDKTRNYGISELQERFTDFTPFSVVAFAPTVEVGDIVRLTHPETLVSKTYLVLAVSHQRNGVAKMQILNYDLQL
jgi:hypothetical protein